MMKYTNSSMVTYTKLSPNNSGKRTHVIDRITPHCVVGQVSAESLGDWFSKSSTKASSNYGIDKNGRIGLYVEEKNRSWCSSSNANDQRAVTIECASDTKEPYAFNDIVYQRLIELCTDICRRNGKTKLIWFGNKDKTLNYSPKGDEMILTVHRWFANKSCPGNWLYARMGNLAERVTDALGGNDGSGIAGGSSGNGEGAAGSGRTVSCSAEAEVSAGCPFLVRVTAKDLRIRTGAGTDTAWTGQYIPPGTYTIIEVRSGKGSAKGWGRLKSDAGFISLDYAVKV